MYMHACIEKFESSYFKATVQDYYHKFILNNSYLSATAITMDTVQQFRFLLLRTSQHHIINNQSDCSTDLTTVATQ